MSEQIQVNTNVMDIFSNSNLSLLRGILQSDHYPTTDFSTFLSTAIMPLTGKNLEEISDITGVSKDTLEDLLEGSEIPSVEVIKAMAVLFNDETSALKFHAYATATNNIIKHTRALIEALNAIDKLNDEFMFGE